MQALAALGQRAASKVSTAVETASHRLRVHTGAMDIIVVMAADGTLRSTDWQFQVGRDASVRWSEVSYGPFYVRMTAQGDAHRELWESSRLPGSPDAQECLVAVGSAAR